MASRGYYLKKVAARSEYSEHRSKHTGLGEILRLLEAEGHKEDELLESFQLIKEALGLLPSITTDVDSQFAPLFKEAVERLNQTIYAYRTESIDVKNLKAELKRKTSSVEQEYRRKYEEKCGDIPKREMALHNAKFDLEVRERKLNDKEKDLKEKEESLKELETKIKEMETPEGRDAIRKVEKYLASVIQDQWTNKAIAWSIGAILSGTQIPDFGKKT